MIYLGLDGKPIDTENLFDRIGGTPQSPLSPPQQIDLSALSGVPQQAPTPQAAAPSPAPLAQPVAPVEPPAPMVQPQEAFVPGRPRQPLVAPIEPATPVAPEAETAPLPTSGSYVQMLKSEEFHRATTPERQEMFRQWQTRVLEPALASARLRNDDKDVVRQLMLSRFQEDVPKLRGAFFSDTARAGVGGLAMGTGALVASAGRAGGWVGLDSLKNAAYDAAESISEFGQEVIGNSSTRAQEKRRLAAQRLEDADNQAEAAWAVVRNFASMPVATMAEMAGSIAPIIAATAASAVVGAPTAATYAAGLGVGALQSVGGTVMGIMDSNVNYLTQQNEEFNLGKTPEEIQAEARELVDDGINASDALAVLAGAVEAIPIGRLTSIMRGSKGSARTITKDTPRATRRDRAAATGRELGIAGGGGAASGAIGQAAQNIGVADPDTVWYDDLFPAAAQEMLFGAGFGTASAVGQVRRMSRENAVIAELEERHAEQLEAAQKLSREFGVAQGPTRPDDPSNIGPRAADVAAPASTVEGGAPTAPAEPAAPAAPNAEAVTAMREDLEARTAEFMETTDGTEPTGQPAQDPATGQPEPRVAGDSGSDIPAARTGRSEGTTDVTDSGAGGEPATVRDGGDSTDAIQPTGPEPSEVSPPETTGEGDAAVRDTSEPDAELEPAYRPAAEQPAGQSVGERVADTPEAGSDGSSGQPRIYRTVEEFLAEEGEVQAAAREFYDRSRVEGDTRPRYTDFWPTEADGETYYQRLAPQHLDMANRHIAGRRGREKKDLTIAEQRETTIPYVFAHNLGEKPTTATINKMRRLFTEGEAAADSPLARIRTAMEQVAELGRTEDADAVRWARELPAKFFEYPVEVQRNLLALMEEHGVSPSDYRQTGPLSLVPLSGKRASLMKLTDFTHPKYIRDIQSRLSTDDSSNKVRYATALAVFEADPAPFGLSAEASSRLVDRLSGERRFSGRLPGKLEDGRTTVEGVTAELVGLSKAEPVRNQKDPTPMAQLRDRYAESDPTTGAPPEGAEVRRAAPAKKAAAKKAAAKTAIEYFVPEQPSLFAEEATPPPPPPPPPAPAKKAAAKKAAAKKAAAKKAAPAREEAPTLTEAEALARMEAALAGTPEPTPEPAPTTERGTRAARVAPNAQAALDKLSDLEARREQLAEDSNISDDERRLQIDLLLGEIESSSPDSLDSLSDEILLTQSRLSNVEREAFGNDGDNRLEALRDLLYDDLSSLDSPVQYSRTTPRTSSTQRVASVVQLKAALSPAMAATVDARVRLGDAGQRGGIVFNPASDVLPSGVTLSEDANGVVQAVYVPDSGITYFASDAIPINAAEGVYLHEAIHGNPNDWAASEALYMLEEPDAVPEGAMKDFYRRVAARMDSAGVAGRIDEAMPYIVEEALTQGRINGFSAVDSRFMDWLSDTFGEHIGNLIRDVVARIRAWRISRGAEITPAVDDMIQLARQSARQLARGIALGQHGAEAPVQYSRLGAIVNGKISGATEAAVSMQDYLKVGRAQSPGRVTFTFPEWVASAAEALHRAFVNRLLPLKKMDETLHQHMEQGHATRNNLLANMEKTYVKPMVKIIDDSAKKLRARASVNKVLAGYRKVRPNELADSIGIYAQMKYASEANLARYQIMKDAKVELEESLATFVRDNPDYAVFAVDFLGDLPELMAHPTLEGATFDPMARLQEMWDEAGLTGFAPDLEVSVVRDGIKNLLPKEGRAARIKEMEDMLSARRKLDRDIQLHEMNDHRTLDSAALQESGYRPIAGFTTAMAKAEVDKIESGPLWPYIKPGYDALIEVQQATNRLGVEYGIYSETDVASWDGLDSYVPTTGKDNKAQLMELADQHLLSMDDLTHSIHEEMSFGVGINNRNLFRVREGRVSMPDPANKSVIDRLYLMVNQIATNNFKNEAVAQAIEPANPALAAMVREGTATSEDVAEFVRSRQRVMRDIAVDGDSSTPDDVQSIELLRDYSMGQTNDNDFRHMLLVRGEGGQTERMPIVFRINDEAVAAALKNPGETGGFWNKYLGPIVRFQQRMITQADWMFPLKSLVRDIPERVGLLASRSDLVAEDGTAISVDFSRDLANVAGFVARRLPFFTKSQRANNAVWQATFNGKFLENQDGQFLRDFILSREGAGASTQAAMLSGSMVGRTSIYNRQLGAHRRAVTSVSDALTGWSEYFEVQSSYATYRMLRDKGMGHQEASYAVLNTMNFGRRGEFVGALRPVYFFINPALQGANNVVQAIKSDTNRWSAARKSGAPLRTAIKTSLLATRVMMSYALVSSIGQSLLSMMSGPSDEENSDILGTHYDELPLSRRMRQISVPLPGGDGVFASMPIPYGMGAIGWGVGQIVRDFSQGRMSAADASVELGTLLGAELTGAPFSAVDISEHPIEWFFRTIMPAGATGIIDVATGRNRWGGDISKRFLSDDLPRSAQGRANTEQFYRDLAVALDEMTGGVFDYTPEEWKALITGTLTGPLARIIKGIDIGVEDPANALINIAGVGSFVNSGFETKIEAKFYPALDAVRDDLQRLNRISPYIGSGTETIYELTNRALGAGFDYDKALAIGAAKRAEREMRGKDTDARRLIMLQFLRSTQ